MFFVAKIWKRALRASIEGYLAVAASTPTYSSLSQGTFTFDIQRAALKTCDLWDQIDEETWPDKHLLDLRHLRHWLQFWQLRTSIQTIFGTWQLRVTLDSICNSFDVYEDGHWSIITKSLSLFLSLCILGINSIFTGFHFSDIHSNFQKLNWHYWCDHGMWWWSDKIKDGGSLVLRI